MDFRHLGFVFILLVVCYLLQCFYSFIPSMNPVLSRYIPMPDGGAEGGLHEGQLNLPPFLLVSLFLARDVLPEYILIATDRTHKKPRLNSCSPPELHRLPYQFKTIQIALFHFS